MRATGASDVIVQEISIEAAAATIFEALTDPEQVVQWWGIEGGFRATGMESDLRIGGPWSLTGVGGSGQPFQVSGEYRVIGPPTILSFTWKRGLGEDPAETLVRIELTERAGVTDLRLTHSGLATRALREKNSGWPLVLGALKAFTEKRKD